MQVKVSTLIGQLIKETMDKRNPFLTADEFLYPSLTVYFHKYFLIWYYSKNIICQPRFCQAIAGFYTQKDRGRYSSRYASFHLQNELKDHKSSFVASFM